ncbi:hypothetical protein PanWU01x14_260560 [Parasponia andersonii]|uniref:Uncharacterized protein n=1 Tax=Parasponia andersonii TaxID=3476 RepID=A0A2P5B8Y4_PARAD|nr:hypothetical protein PanWU01x14_260560 [Parasponia andersonii]
MDRGKDENTIRMSSLDSSLDESEPSPQVTSLLWAPRSTLESQSTVISLPKIPGTLRTRVPVW